MPDKKGTSSLLPKRVRFRRFIPVSKDYRFADADRLFMRLLQNDADILRTFQFDEKMHETRAIILDSVILAEKEKIRQMNPLLSYDELFEIEKAIKATFGREDSPFYDTMSIFGRYMSLTHGYDEFITRGYHRFENYVSGLWNKASIGKRFAKNLLAHPDFREIIEILKEKRPEDHPKFHELREFIVRDIYRDKTKIVFTGSEQTALIFENYFKNECGIKSAVILDELKTKKSRNAALPIFDAILSREIATIFVSKNLERPAGFPSLDMVVHYALPDKKQNKKRITWLPEDRQGFITILGMDHPFDRNLYFALNPGGKRKRKQSNQTTLSLDELPF